MLRALCSKEPLALGLPVEDPLQACDPEQGRLQRQDAQTDNVTVTRLHNNLLFHHLPQNPIQKVNRHVCLGVCASAQLLEMPCALDCLFDSLMVQVAAMACSIVTLTWHVTCHLGWAAQNACLHQGQQVDHCTQLSA